MRKVYFVRHGAPEFPGGEKMYVGTTDVPLSTLGRLQACVTGSYLRQQGFERVFTSPLARALDTAKMIAPNPAVVENLREMYAGDWEGLTFRRVQEQWPELYRLRGGSRYVPIPGAEDLSEVQKRFSSAVEGILNKTGGDIVIVAHITVLRTYLCGYLDIPLAECRSIALPNASVSVLEFGKTASPACVGAVPQLPLTDELCRQLLRAAGASEEILLHCERVAEKADEIAVGLNAAGCTLDRDNIRRAALLHDIARREQNHAAVGGSWLEQLGYVREAKPVARHHDVLPVEISEETVLSLADRFISGTDEVNLEERFARSERKCKDEAARAAHREKFENAKALQALFESIRGK